MLIVGIDPGPEESGVVLWDGKTIHGATTILNEQLLGSIHKGLYKTCVVAIERIRGFGQTAGNEIFDTCEWIGRFEEAATYQSKKVALIPRREVKLNLCECTTAKDKDVSEALKERIGKVGNKKSPGPLYGVSGHCWAALAVAVTAYDKEGHNAD
jgi:hypothetical protein